MFFAYIELGEKVKKINKNPSLKRIR